MFTLSDSMLNQIDEIRLSKRLEVRVRCHGGCTIKCVYNHLPDVLLQLLTIYCFKFQLMIVFGRIVGISELKNCLHVLFLCLNPHKGRQ